MMLREPCVHGRYEEHPYFVPNDPDRWLGKRKCPGGRTLTDAEALERLLYQDCGKCDGTGDVDRCECSDPAGEHVPCPSCGGSGRTARMPVIPTSLRPGGPPGYWVPASMLKGGDPE